MTVDSQSDPFDLRRFVDAQHGRLAHDVVGPRLVKHTRLVIDCGTSDIDLIFGCPDNLKRAPARFGSP